MKHVRTLLAAALVAAVGLVAASAPASNAAAANTTLTLKIANCEGCVIGLTSVMAADYEDLWSSKEKKVKNGEVTFKVPADRTAGLSIGVEAPWEGAVPAHTIVAMRYKGYAVGDKVSYSDIKPAKKASGCWAGTTDSRRDPEGRRQEGHRHGQHGPGHGLDRLRQEDPALPAADAADLRRRARPRRTSSAAAPRPEPFCGPVRMTSGPGATFAALTLDLVRR